MSVYSCWGGFCSLRLLPVVGPVTYSVCLSLCVCVCVVERDREQQLESRRRGRKCFSVGCDRRRRRRRNRGPYSIAAAPSRVDFESRLVESPTFFFSWWLRATGEKPQQELRSLNFFSSPSAGCSSYIYLFFENTFDFTRPHFSRLFSSILSSPLLLLFVCVPFQHQTKEAPSLGVGRRGRRYCLYPFPFLLLIFSVSPLAAIHPSPSFLLENKKRRESSHPPHTTNKDSSSSSFEKEKHSDHSLSPPFLPVGRSSSFQPAI